MTISLSPTLGAPGSVALGTNRTTAIAGVTLSEAGNVAGETFTVILSDSTGLLSATGAGLSGSGTTRLTITGALAQVNADLATLKDTDPGVGVDAINLAATDSLGNKAHAATITVTASGLPVITVPKAQQTGVGQPLSIAGLSLSEAQGAVSETFTVTLSDNAGLLSATGTGVTGSGTRNLTLTGSLAQVNADLATLKDTDGTAGADTITINARDSFGNVATVGTIGLGVSARPIITVPGAQLLGVGQPRTIAGVSLTEAYAVTGETFTVTVSDNRGLLSAVGPGVSGSGTTHLTLTGSLAQVNAALAALSDTDNVVTSDSITISALDSFGNSAAGQSIALSVNGLPAISAPAGSVIGIGQAASIAGVGINEAGNTAGGEIFTASLVAATGLLSATGTGVSGSGTTHLTITGSLAQVNAALATLSDIDGTAGPDPITITTTDSFGNAAASKSIAVTVNGAPVIGAPSIWTTATGQASPVNGVGLTESGNPSGDSFTVTLVDAAGVLSATGAGISGSGTNSLTITGSLAQVNGDLSTLKALDPTQGPDTITITAGDSFGNTAGSATIAVTVSDQPVTVTGPTSPPPSNAIIYAPVIPQPTNPGDVVGLVLQNNQTTPLAARYVTFEEAFSTGQVPTGRQLVATINGQQVAVQMDVQTTNPDGSVKTALITLQQPVLAASSSTGVMLSLAPSASTQPDVNIANAVFNTSINLTIHGTGGNTPFSINVDQALQQALTSGAVSYWQRGPLATQVRIDVPVTGSLHIVMDLTEFADGQTSADIAFDNDLAMQPTGGTISYDVTMTQNGQVALQQNNITQYQYQTWDDTLYSNGAPQVNIQHDIAALEATGLIQNYDLSTGVSASLINNETASLTANAAKFAILGPGDILQYMPTTGGRPDIGPQPAWNVAWLLTGNQAAATYALDMANAAGSIPWHMYNPQTGQYLQSTTYPTLWVDPRGGSSSGTTGLTQQADDFVSQSSPGNGWALDPAHQPDTDYIAYLMTGNRYYLDQLNAQASWDVLAITPSARNYSAGIVATNQVQVRGQAWSLREIVEAASANPDGSAEKAYFTQVMDNNFTYLLNEAESSNEGQASGWIPGNSGATVAPWQQDYFATTVILAAQMGDQPAAQLLAWETNFLAGLFTSALQGFDPYTGATYQIWAFNSQGTPYQTWAQIENATQLNGGAQYVTPGSWSPLAYGAYQAEAEAVLAGDITVTGSTQAMQAYGWLVAHTQLTVAFEQSNPLWDIAPRLPDGSVLSASEIQISHSVAGGSTHLIGGSGDNLLYAGLGNDTLQGGSGTNMLFANGGNNTLIGGPGSDYMFAGAGNDTLIGGSGNDYEQAGTGSAEFVLSTSDIGNDIIAGFKIGTDHLHVLGANAAPLGGGAINALIAGATSDGSGNAVLAIAPGHTATLQGIQTSQLSTVLFN